MAIHMLDLDPRAAAKAHADSHVPQAFLFAIQQLANAWHELYSNWSLPLDARELPHNVVRRIVPDSSHPRPTIPLRTYDADGPARPGDKPVWLLMGQRIPQRANETHASGLWVRQLGGNYSWAWRFASALLDEASPKTIELRAQRALFTLEEVPPPLADTVDKWSEAPLTMPNIFRQESDGFYDSVESWRTYYAYKYQHAGQWWRVKPPKWWKENLDKALALRTADGEALNSHNTSL